MDKGASYYGGILSRGEQKKGDEGARGVWGVMDEALGGNRVSSSSSSERGEPETKPTPPYSSSSSRKNPLSKSNRNNNNMSIHKLSSVVINPSAKHTATVIFMHGLGDSGNGWSPVMNMLKAPHVKYICPNAPDQPVTLNMGMKMPSWYDIYSLDDKEANEDEEGIEKSANSIKALIEQEIESGIPANRIVVGGFSQGGAIALWTGLTYTKASLAGVMALSCYLPLRKKLPGVMTDANKKVPLLQCHGDSDMVVRYKWGEMSHDVLKAFNPNAKFKTYPGLGHGADPQEIADMKYFLDDVIPPQ
eukprot:Nk52_evm45s745 gene=Nk52_evmTU45s745